MSVNTTTLADLLQREPIDFLTLEKRLSTLEQVTDVPPHVQRDLRECLHVIEAKLPELSPLDWRVSRQWHGVKRRIEMLLHKSMPYQANADMGSNGHSAGLLTREQKRRWHDPEGRNLPAATAKPITVATDPADSPRRWRRENQTRGKR